MDRDSEYRRRFGYDKDNPQLHGEQVGDYLRSQDMQGSDYNGYTSPRPDGDPYLNGVGRGERRGKLTTGQKVLIGVGIGASFLLPIILMIFIIAALVVMMPSVDYLDDYDYTENYKEHNKNKSDTKDWGTDYSEKDDSITSEDDGKAHLTFGEGVEDNTKEKAEEHRKEKESKRGTGKRDYTITYDSDGNMLFYNEDGSFAGSAEVGIPKGEGE